MRLRYSGELKTRNTHDSQNLSTPYTESKWEVTEEMEGAHQGHTDFLEVKAAGNSASSAKHQ